LFLRVLVGIATPHNFAHAGVVDFYNYQEVCCPNVCRPFLCVNSSTFNTIASKPQGRAITHMSKRDVSKLVG
jgi:hypothetical protein